MSRVQSVSWDSVYAGSAIKPISPAVLLIDDRRTLVAAVAHPGRFANARPISFASELAAQLEDLAARGTPHSP